MGKQSMLYVPENLNFLESIQFKEYDQIIYTKFLTMGYQTI